MGTRNAVIAPASFAPASSSAFTVQCTIQADSVDRSMTPSGAIWSYKIMESRE